MMPFYATNVILSSWRGLKPGSNKYMPAYSFQERFIPFLLDGSKDHTVRKERAGRSRHARPGETLQLYYGMRTKWCRKIGEATCWTVLPIRITETDILVGGYYHTENGPGAQQDLLFFPLPPEERGTFAWKDGFRPECSTATHPVGSFELMLRFWKHTHQLPFQGVVIYWKDFRPNTEKSNKIVLSG